MDDSSTQNMILRSIYLPPKVDQTLRAIAFTRQISKGDLMRSLIDEGLKRIEMSGEKTIAQLMDERFAALKTGGERSVMERPRSRKKKVIAIPLERVAAPAD